MKIFIRCSIETDVYSIEDFKKGAFIMVSPIGPLGPLPFVGNNLKLKRTDKSTNSVELKNDLMEPTDV